MSIVIQNVSKLYGQQKALDKVSFEVKPGEIVGFLGPNGAGKSTMMKIITGFIPATVGKVKVCGLPIQEDTLKIKKKIGYLAEHNPLYYEMYVREYLHFLAGVFKLKRAKPRIDDIIEIVGLTVEQNKKIEALSKGYKQRVGLAQALLHDPEVLILDEPTTGLDPNQLHEIRGLIKNIGTHKTVMLSTHIMQEVEAICDRVIIINKGRIVADEKTTQLNSTQSPNQIVLSVSFDQKLSKSGLESVEGVIQAEQKPDSQEWLIAVNQANIRNNIFQYAMHKKATVLSINEEKERLEDIFKKLTVS